MHGPHDPLQAAFVGTTDDRALQEVHEVLPATVPRIRPPELRKDFMKRVCEILASREGSGWRGDRCVYHAKAPLDRISVTSL
jgi:hypothetical protein